MVAEERYFSGMVPGDDELSGKGEEKAGKVKKRNREVDNLTRSEMVSDGVHGSKFCRVHKLHHFRS